MDYRSTGNSNRIGQRRPVQPPRMPRGIFGGNRSVKWGLLAIGVCVLFVQIYYRAANKVLSGPIDDVFRRNPSGLLIVYGTGGDSPDALREYTHRVAKLLTKSLGHEVLAYPDTEVDRALAGEYSLLLYGSVDGNRITGGMRDELPFTFSGDTVRLGEKSFAGDTWRLIFAEPNPNNPRRYILVYTGPSDSSVVGINLLGSPNFVHHDTTDFVLAVGGTVAASGYFDKSDQEHWKLPF